jgi:hypothetical protein
VKEQRKEGGIEGKKKEIRKINSYLICINCVETVTLMSIELACEGNYYGKGMRKETVIAYFMYLYCGIVKNYKNLRSSERSEGILTRYNL